jgi:hypothetical protein
VHPDHKEFYLPEFEFMDLFKMNKNEWFILDPFIKASKKKEVGLN